MILALMIRSRGAMVARLTPDQKVACSNHVGLMFLFFPFFTEFISKKPAKKKVRPWVGSNHQPFG